MAREEEEGGGGRERGSKCAGPFVWQEENEEKKKMKGEVDNSIGSEVDVGTTGMSPKMRRTSAEARRQGYTT